MEFCAIRENEGREQLIGEKFKKEDLVTAEFVRKQKNSIRSMHPFNSHSSVGAHSKYICLDNSKNSFGAETPKDRMLKINTKYLSVGLPPRLTCSYIHHVELLMGVPYRYTKEFYHPIKRNKITKKE